MIELKELSTTYVDVAQQQVAPKGPYGDRSRS